MTPPDPAEIERRVRDSFARQSIMATIGARLVRVEAGEVEIELPVADHIGQQHGFVHAGVVATIADSAAGYAALSVAPPGVGILTAEFKINLLAAAAGERLVAVGRVKRAGRLLCVCTADVEAVCAQGRKSVAFMTATIVNVAGREGVAD